MERESIYKDQAWRVHFFDGFHCTSQVILGKTRESAVKQFEKSTGFKAFAAILIGS